MRNMIINSKQQHRDAHAHSDFPWGGGRGGGEGAAVIQVTRHQLSLCLLTSLIKINFTTH